MLLFGYEVSDFLMKLASLKYCAMLGLLLEYLHLYINNPNALCRFAKIQLQKNFTDSLSDAITLKLNRIFTNTKQVSVQ